MFFRRLYIKWKIWRIQSQIDDIPSQLNYYWISLLTMNIRHCEGKLDIDKFYGIFYKEQIDKKKRLQKELENCKKILSELC